MSSGRRRSLWREGSGQCVCCITLRATDWVHDPPVGGVRFGCARLLGAAIRSGTRPRRPDRRHGSSSSGSPSRSSAVPGLRARVPTTRSRASLDCSTRPGRHCRWRIAGSSRDEAIWSQTARRTSAGRSPRAPPGSASMKSTGAGNPTAVSPTGQSSAWTARSMASVFLAWSAAQCNAALLDGESSRPTTISFLIPHFHRAGSDSHSDPGGAGPTRTTALRVPEEDLRPKALHRPSERMRAPSGTQLTTNQPERPGERGPPARRRGTRTCRTDIAEDSANPNDQLDQDHHEVVEVPLPVCRPNPHDRHRRLSVPS